MKRDFFMKAKYANSISKILGISEEEQKSYRSFFFLKVSKSSGVSIL